MAIKPDYHYLGLNHLRHPLPLRFVPRGTLTLVRSGTPSTGPSWTQARDCTLVERALRQFRNTRFVLARSLRRYAGEGEEEALRIGGSAFPDALVDKMKPAHWMLFGECLDHDVRLSKRFSSNFIECHPLIRILSSYTMNKSINELKSLLEGD
jgi:hypothetical protein